MPERPDEVDGQAPFPGGVGGQNGSGGIGGGGAFPPGTPGDAPTPGVTPGTGDGGGTTSAQTPGEAEARAALVRMRMVVADAEVQMRVAIARLADKNAEIGRLQSLVSSMSSGPQVDVLNSRLADVTRERDDALARVRLLTAQMNNGSGVTSGSLLVSFSQDVEGQMDELSAVTSQLRVASA